MKRTKVVLDDKIVAECMKATGIKTRKAAHPYHSGPHVIGTLHCGSRIRNAEEENTRGDKPVRDSLKTVTGKRRDDVGDKLSKIHCTSSKNQ